MTKPYAVFAVPPKQLAELTRLMIEEVKEAAVFFIDPDGIIESWNSAAEVMKEYTAAEAIGEHLRLLYTEEDRERGWPEHNLLEAKKHGFFREERWRRRKSGTLFWARILLTALREDSGKLVGFSKITLDLTEHKLLEHCVEEKEETRQVLHAANAGKWTWYPETGMIDVCANFLALLGHAGSDTSLPYDEWLMFLHPDHRARMDRAFKEGLAGNPQQAMHTELRMRLKCGSFRWFAAHAAWYRKPNGEVVLQGVNIDIEELKTVVDERQQAIDRLKDEDARKNEFLAMLAHELRNPLAPISAGAELLRIIRHDAEQVRRTSDIITRQVRHMTTLIDDLLDVSRVTRGLAQLEREAVDMRRVVATAVEQVQPLVQRKHHQLAVHVPPVALMVSGDAKRLVQVVANLLNNAAKYTAQGGVIALRVDADETQLVLSVNDNGIGMTPVLIERVFDLFAQAERASDRSSGGLGVGLALVKSLVELHGGQVAASSRGAGQGSTFTVVLPRLGEEAQAPASADARPALAGTPRALKILVVDDNVDAALMLATLLETSGHQVVTEHCAADALTRAMQFVPEVCLIDIGLPDRDGLALAGDLRALPATSRSTLIAVTGYGQEIDKRNARAAGFDHHLTKPVDIEQLTAILASPAVSASEAAP